MLSVNGKLRGTGSRGLYRALTVCSVRGTEVRISLPMLFCCALWLLSGQFSFLPAVLSSVLWHEACHVLTSYTLGFSTESITLYPFGGCAEIPFLDLNGTAECLTAAAGPLGSLLAVFLWQNGEIAGILPAWADFVLCGRDMALINLLPLEPLDGGRIIRTLLRSSLGEKRGRKTAKVLRIILLSGLTVYGLYRMIGFADGALLPCTAFLWSAFPENNKTPVSRHTLRRDAERTVLLKAEVTETLVSLYARMTGRRYYCVLVTENGEPKGIISENDVEKALMKNSQGCAGDAVNGFFDGQWRPSGRNRTAS